MQVVDMHCDTISALYAKKQAGEQVTLLENNGHVDINRMKKGHYGVQNFALFVDMYAPHTGDPWQHLQALFALYMEQLLENEDVLSPIYAYEDIAYNQKQGKMSAMLTVEEGGVCGGDLEKLRTLYKQGVRMLTLTWNYENELGYPNLHKERRNQIRLAEQGGNYSVINLMLQEYLNTPNRQGHLTEKGIAFVEEMERMGMIVDVSHLSDAGFYDVCERLSVPFVASHSNARSICPCVRNLTDDMIRRLAEKGGVMGLNFCADFLTQVPMGVKNPGTMAAVAEHARHIVKVGGIECLGLGSDFDGIDTHAELDGADKMPLLWDTLHEAGFTEKELDKIFAENVLRIYREILR